MDNKTKSIEVNYLARVEGEGGLKVKIENNTVKEVELNIFEPPRFFEAFLRGRKFTEAPDITSRICGICPIAYQTSAFRAMENACQIQTTPTIESLRRLLFCGEWIESHTLHVHMLHAPDFLGFESAIHMAKKFPKDVERGLKIKEMGNTLMSTIGGREIHPINVRVGGFYRLPTQKELQKLLDDIKKARDLAVETAKWVSKFPFPEWERNYEFVSLYSEKDHYPIENGRLHSNRGLDIPATEYETHFTEIHMPHTTALHSVLGENEGNPREYLVGPLARFNLSFDSLSAYVKEIANQISFRPPVLNPFKSIVVRSLEILYALDEAVRIISEYSPEGPASVDVKPRAAVGYGFSEAPRGLLYHRYQINNEGIIEEAKIVPPTSQNQKSIETDLKQYIQTEIHRPQKELTWKCEQTVRNYDPCISCAAHFLETHWEVT